jgi:hypothetical protein
LLVFVIKGNLYCVNLHFKLVVLKYNRGGEKVENI